MSLTVVEKVSDITSALEDFEVSLTPRPVLLGMTGFPVPSSLKTKAEFVQ